jgi:hypothetical protein
MSGTEKYHVPKLTADNYVNWMIKMKSVLKAKELYQLVLGKEPTKACNSNGKLEDFNDSRRLDKAHALIITRIHSSISSQVHKNGGKDDPIKLWANIIKFGASKKQENIFKAWYRLLHLPLCSENVLGFISQLWDALATLQLLDAKVEDKILGHIILMKMPSDLSHVCNAITASGTSSVITVTHKTVLEMPDSQLKADASSGVQKKSIKPHDSNAATALLTQKYPQGKHLSSSTHSANNCFSLHPGKLVKYRKFLKAKQEAKAHLATFVPSSVYNAKEVHSDHLSQSVNDLVKSFTDLPADLADYDSDGLESVASLL